MATDSFTSRLIHAFIRYKATGISRDDLHAAFVDTDGGELDACLAELVRGCRVLLAYRHFGRSPETVAMYFPIGRR